MRTWARRASGRQRGTGAALRAMGGDGEHAGGDGQGRRRVHGRSLRVAAAWVKWKERHGVMGKQEEERS